NLRAMATMRAAFGVPTGWSDHTPGTELPLLAATLGAAVIEKHLTLDRRLPGPDHRASLEPDAFAALVAGVRTVEVGLGTGDKSPVAAELPIAAVARRSLHWRRALPEGSVVGDDDLVALRPASGLSPARQAEIVGQRTKRSVEAGTAVETADVEADADSDGSRHPDNNRSR
ncbi:MAG TPA: N-acetylneuraminate synthase family protein, partial [Candidatus Acidoferrum sp.]|nr:N-acetylneuraminate synthase family protein [Candidatus Acidoferrum sp.]